MGIEWRLAVLMAQRGMNYRRLGIATGLHPNTISKLKHKPPVRLEMETLVRLCEALHCQPGDLLTYCAEATAESEPMSTTTGTIASAGIELSAASSETSKELSKEAVKPDSRVEVR